jgi:hypothetical protein
MALSKKNEQLFSCVAEGAPPIWTQLIAGKGFNQMVLKPFLLPGFH